MAAKKVKLTPRKTNRVCHKGRPLAFSADDMWNAIDEIAAINGLTVSRMGLMAGLSSTSLNPSKRCRQRGGKWLSMESLSLILAAIGMEPAEFSRVLQGFVNK